MKTEEIKQSWRLKKTQWRRKKTSSGAGQRSQKTFELQVLEERILRIIQKVSTEKRRCYFFTGGDQKSPIW